MSKSESIPFRAHALRDVVRLPHGPSAFGLGVIFALAAVGTACSPTSAKAPTAQEYAAHHEDHGAPDPHAAHHGEHGSADPHAAHHGDHGSSHDPHASHRAALEKSDYSVSTERYAVPGVSLLDQSGDSLALRTLLESDKPVALNFIFTTCTTICPVMTATFAQMRRDLGEAAKKVRLVSVTIDPEHDRPEVLEAYAKRFGAGEDWFFLTGSRADVWPVVMSFQAYAGSKTNHQPLTFLKKPQDPEWTRIDGLASGKDLAHEVATRLLN